MSLLDSIQNCLRKQPGLTAGKIASELSVPRHEVNSLLCRNNKKIFKRIDNGEKAPTWTLFSADGVESNNKVVDFEKTTLDNPGLAIVKRIVEKIDFEISNSQKFETRTGATRLEVVLVSEGSNSSFTRYEVLDVDDLIIIVNEDSILNKSTLVSERNSLAFHILHCIADCLTQYKIRRTEVIEEDFIPIKNEVFLKLLSMNFDSV